MKKDLDKLFVQSIQTYYFLLLIVVIIKLLGGNYFDIIQDSYALKSINNFVSYWKLENVWYMFTLYINVFITLSIACNDNSNKMKKYSVLGLIIAFILQLLKSNINIPYLFATIDFIYLLILSIIYTKINNKKFTKLNLQNYIVYMIMLLFLQLISISIRNITIMNQNKFNNSFVISIVLNLDYLLVMIIIYKLYFIRGGKSLWDLVVSYSSQKLISLKTSLKDLHIKFQNRPKLTKEQKITHLIYTPLYLLWNLFTMLIIVIIAMLNDALAEAIFITIAFWMNKRVFGKPFHFKSVWMCFCFSSIVYYVLTRITFHIESSLFIPIFLGVLLSYVTSHFVHDNNKLYKGMDEQELQNIVKKVTDDPISIEICKEYYCDRYNDVKISNMTHYSVPSVRNKRQRINKELKRLYI
jgi:hypothetical protein